MEGHGDGGLQGRWDADAVTQRIIGWIFASSLLSGCTISTAPSHHVDDGFRRVLLSGCQGEGCDELELEAKERRRQCMSKNIRGSLCQEQTLDLAFAQALARQSRESRSAIAWAEEQAARLQEEARVATLTEERKTCDRRVADIRDRYERQLQTCVASDQVAQPGTSTTSQRSQRQPVGARYLRCRDGSISPTCVCGGPRRGCCSRHGGVAGCE